MWRLRWSRCCNSVCFFNDVGVVKYGTIGEFIIIPVIILQRAQCLCAVIDANDGVPVFKSIRAIRDSSFLWDARILET
jgi:hypothetical protein